MKPEEFKCKYCSDSGCSEGNYHDEQLVKMAKKEILDDIEKIIDKVYYSFTETNTTFELGFDKLKKQIKELKEHLNTNNKEGVKK